MLQNLQVKNLALIQKADVELEKGLNILTGETGAGKSIIIGSMNLALGEKAPKELVRDSEDAAYVELVFSVENERTIKKLQALEVEPEDGVVVLSRKITQQRSVGRINGETVSASKMREVSDLLIAVCGQHENQILLSPKKHLEILDEYARDKVTEIKQKLSGEYRSYRRLKEELLGAEIDTDEQRRELSLLSYEVKEIEEANPVPGEDGELEEQFRRFSNGKKIMESAGLAYAATGGEEKSASELIGRAVRELSSVMQYDRNIAGMQEQLLEIDSLLSDFNHELSGYLDAAEFDGERFYETQKRLDIINHLKSKYGNSLEAVLEVCEEKKARIEKLRDYDTYLQSLTESVKKQEQLVEKLSKELSSLRREAAESLTAAIRDALADLNFLDVSFTMQFEQMKDYTANGTDSAQFLISTNPGEPLLPLSRVASGGELSRIMLAIKTVMADSDDIDTLIFDEIDNGISGRTAQLVSEKMNLLGRNHQVICITHLPQIAAMADAHFLIEKSVKNEMTVSDIKKLDEEESVGELARMLGGVALTDTVYQNAREMKQMAYMKK